MNDEIASAVMQKTHNLREEWSDFILGCRPSLHSYWLVLLSIKSATSFKLQEMENQDDSTNRNKHGIDRKPCSWKFRCGFEKINVNDAHWI